MSESATTLEPLAHSARDGAPEQSYRDHAGNVFRDATGFARAAAALSPKWCGSFVAAVERAAAYHDLGKLDELFQEVLRHNRKNKHGFNHVEAGTAHLLRLKQFEAALRAAERLARLDEYVAGLSAKNPSVNDREQQRLKLRQEVYRACRERKVKPNERILACDIRTLAAGLAPCVHGLGGWETELAVGSAGLTDGAAPGWSVFAADQFERSPPGSLVADVCATDGGRGRVSGTEERAGHSADLALGGAARRSARDGGISGLLPVGLLETWDYPLDKPIMAG